MLSPKPSDLVPQPALCSRLNSYQHAHSHHHGFRDCPLVFNALFFSSWCCRAHESKTASLVPHRCQWLIFDNGTFCEKVPCES